MRDPEHCPHMRITRIVDEYRCLDCGTEFLPKDKTLLDEVRFAAWREKK
jgi:hypothetical protein